jgi:GT2 family glycosyltransferase
MNNKASIIVIHYSNINYTVNCVNSILKAKTKYKYEIIIINNANKDVDYRLIKNVFQRQNNVHIYSNNSGNSGFSAGIQIGSRCANYEYLVILDNDTLVNDYWLDKLLNCFSDITVGISTSEIINSKKDIYTIIGGKINILGFSYSNKIKRSKKEDTKNLFYGITSWCIKKSILESIGIDTHFQFFSDDADIGYKTKSLGYKVAPAFGSTVVHLKPSKDNEMNSKTVSYKVQICNRDYLIFTFINLPVIHFIIFFLVFILLKIVFLPFRFLKQDKTIKYDVVGILSLFSKTNDIFLRKYKHTKIRTISYKNLLKQFSMKMYVGTMIFK